MAANTTTENTYESIIKCAHFGLNLAATLAYGIEKVKRVPEIRLENSFTEVVLNSAPAEVVKTPVETVLSILGYVSQICNGVKYMTSVLGFVGGGVTVLGIKLDKVPTWIRITLQILIVFSLIRLALRVHGKHKDKIDLLFNTKKKWEWAISLLSKGGGFAYGIFQLIMFIKAENIPAGQKIFLLSSIADSLTAPLDIAGVDNLVLHIPIPKGEIVYTVLYGSRVMIKSVQTAGILIG